VLCPLTLVPRVPSSPNREIPDSGGRVDHAQLVSGRFTNQNRVAGAVRNTTLKGERPRAVVVVGVVGLFGTDQHVEVGLAGRRGSLVGDAPNGEHHDGGEDAEDDDDHEELDEREAFVGRKPQFGIHTHLFVDVVTLRAGYRHSLTTGETSVRVILRSTADRGIGLPPRRTPERVKLPWTDD